MAAGGGEPTGAPHRLPRRLGAWGSAARGRAAPRVAALPVALPPRRGAYADPASAADLPINGGGDPWVGNLERQRHLLQAGYADRLVGQVLQRLDEVGVFDDAAIVVTADHGIAFSADPNRRLPTPEALPEIMWTPLIVKAPGQSAPRVDDANVQSIDVLPTLAALIGVDIPWSVDGIDVAGDELAARGDRKLFRRFEPWRTRTRRQRWRSMGRLGSRRCSTWRSRRGPDDPISGLYALSGRAELVGQPTGPPPRSTGTPSSSTTSTGCWTARSGCSC